MEYRAYSGTYYIRLDRGDEIIGSLRRICEAERIRSAVYTGIGGCSAAEIQTFDPEKGAFETRTLRGMLELTSMTGNVICGADDTRYLHTHGTFAYRLPDGTHTVAAGHLRAMTVLYTAEIELRPVLGGVIGSRIDPVTGTAMWAFGEESKDA